MTTDCIGPFVEEYYKLSVDGYKVPYVTARPLDVKRTRWHLDLDGRFQIEIGEENFQDFIWFLANAMAISAGYSCHGENCVPMNLFKTQMIGLSSLEEIKTGGDEG